MSRVLSNVDFPSFVMRLGRGVGAGGGLQPVAEFNGVDPNTGEMIGVVNGVGELTEGRSTTIWVEDYQGVYREISANIPAWEGGRVVGDTVYAKDDGGNWISPLPRLLHAPAATNLVKQTNLLSSLIISNVVRTLVPGPDGLANTAANVADQSVTASGECYNNTDPWPLNAGDDYHSLVVWVEKKVSDPGYWSRFGYALNGGTSVDYRILFNAFTGAYYESYNATLGETTVSEHGNWWRVTMTNTVAGGANTGAIHYCKIVASTNGTSENAPVEATGDITMVWEFYTNTPHNVATGLPYFPNASGVPVTRTACALSYDGANHNPDRCGYYLEWEPSVLNVGEGGAFGILTFNSAATTGFVHPPTAQPLRLRQWYASAAYVAFYDAWGAGGVLHKNGFVLDIDVADSLQAYPTNSLAWTNPMSSVGSPVVSTINLSVSNPYVTRYGPIKIYSDSWEDMKAQIEGMMS